MSLHNNRIERTSGAALAINNALDAQMYNNTLAYNNLGEIPGGWQTGGNAVCGFDYTITQAGT